MQMRAFFVPWLLQGPMFQTAEWAFHHVPLWWHWKRNPTWCRVLWGSVVLCCAVAVCVCAPHGRPGARDLTVVWG